MTRTLVDNVEMRILPAGAPGAALNPPTVPTALPTPGVGGAQSITPFLTRFIWRESLIEGGFSWQADFVAEVWQEWLPLLLGRAQDQIQFRMTTQEDGQEVGTEWRSAVVDSSSSAYKGKTLIGCARGGDRRLDMMQQHKLRAWPASKVSDVVSAIALDYGLNVLASETLDIADRWQVQESDWDFLRRITYETAQKGGRGDLFLWLEGGVLYLRAPNLRLPSYRRHTMNVVENRVDNISMRYAGREVDRRGGATLRALGFDWDLKRGLGFDLNAGAAGTHEALAGRVPRAQAAGVRYFPVQVPNIAEVEAHARGRWGRYAPRYFCLQVDSRPDLTLKAGTLMEIDVSQDQDQHTPYGGRFLILEVQHEMVGSSITSTAVCYRREAYTGEEEAQGDPADIQASLDPYNQSFPGSRPTTLRAEVL